MKYICTYCNIYAYDEDKGDLDTQLEPSTRLEDFPDSWLCPVCGMPKEYLQEVRDDVFSIKMNAYSDTQHEKQDRNFIVLLHEKCLREFVESTPYVMVSLTEYVLDRSLGHP